MASRPLTPIHLTDEEREHLESMAATHSLPRTLAVRVRIILLANKGMANKDVVAALGVDPSTVSNWRNRFLALHRSLLRGKGPRHRGPVPQSSRQSHGPVRR